ncbi:MAG: hypothetical protein SOT60_09775 [Bilifractor sp.]|nr:hypothetical protein [Lachnospiraceae bacterium]MDY2838205.1 hypothetical protein [Bilifractor sp.]
MIFKDCFLDAAEKGETKKRMKRQFILIILCILVAGGLIGFLFWNRNQQQTLSRTLQHEALQSESISDEAYVSSASFTKRSMTDAPASVSVQEESAEKVRTDSSADSSAAESDTDSHKKAAHAFQAVSIRGDGFSTYQENISESSVAANLQKLLVAGGSSMTVQDYTMDMAGSLSQMRKAQIPEEDINAYISKHRQNAGNTSLQETETIVRDLSADAVTRNDQSDLPVIGMGYKGGFGDDIHELVEQEKKILGTYSQQDDYIVLGYYPERFTSDEQHQSYDNAMKQAFGDHYVNVDAQVHTGSVTSAETRKAVAQALYDKMKELGYIA